MLFAKPNVLENKIFQIVRTVLSFKSSWNSVDALVLRRRISYASLLSCQTRVIGFKSVTDA